jgi:hypothetical protein
MVPYRRIIDFFPPLCSTAEEDLKGYHFQNGEVEKQLRVVREQLHTNSNELREAGAIIEKLNNEELSFMTKLTRLKDMEEPEPNSIATLVSILYFLFNSQLWLLNTTGSLSKIEVLNKNMLCLHSKY